MKVPLSWLGEWVDWPREWDVQELARRLTFAGFEVESVTPAAPAFSGVVVARIESVARHPQADKLQICRVVTAGGAVGGADSAAALQIVCAAANARAGLVSALAIVGAALPGDTLIRTARLRGVDSAGMLCSARELGLADSSEGILELPPDAPLGADLRDYLDLDDPVLEVNVTPNRGDALSMLGLAREVAALAGGSAGSFAGGSAGGSLRAPDRAAIAALATEAAGPDTGAAATSVEDTHERAAPLTVTLQPGAGAARFLATVLRGVDNARSTPLWMRERLRRVGLRSISPVVDVTNYVMLELGQPMHAYDLARLHGAVLSARRAHAGERLQLLDGREIELAPDVLVIADDEAAVGLAGIMGGMRTAIGAQTRAIALEVAWFAPGAIAGRARRYGLSTDASQRFERGVDWCGQERALARAVQLIRQVAGGAAGRTLVSERTRELPRAPIVPLRPRQLRRLLGTTVAPTDVEQRLRALGMSVTPEPLASREPREAASEPRVWNVQPPSWRLDIAEEVDLIEEVARLGGFDAIAEQDASLPVVMRAAPARRIDAGAVRRTLAARGYQEVITYAFVDPALQRLLLGEQPAVELSNPIAADLAVMRGSLWPGLISVARENLRRQQPRVRVFELGTRFQRGAALTGDAVVGGYREQSMLAGLALGTRLPEQWGSKPTPVDFYDVKDDVQSLLGLTGAQAQVTFEPAALPCLHPGRSARVLRVGVGVGMIGELHPGLVQALDLTYAPLLFELDWVGAFQAEVAQFREISRFPRIRRDISITLPEQTAFASVCERVSVIASSLLKELLVFDVYHGDGIESGRKSIALGLILQDLNRTLTDEDADRTVRAVLDDLRANLNARIRE
ncbi:MAG TPA: phenylalanine--tRNA ligase subunit beta [Steroidobacteraceae bacterium]|nr:phenylalanine--tRNA ligase subunit beta [Steroidobacteraceae bacterium]